MIMGLVMSVVSTIMVFWVKESPRYLYSKGMIDECNEIIQEIARFNKIKRFERIEIPRNN